MIRKIQQSIRNVAFKSFQKNLKKKSYNDLQAGRLLGGWHEEIRHPGLAVLLRWELPVSEVGVLPAQSPGFLRGKK